MVRRALAGTILLVLAGCGGDTQQRAADRPAGSGGGPEQVEMGTEVRGAPGDSSAARPKCTYTGRWDRCTVTERLERSGLAPRPIDGPEGEPGLGTPALAYMVGKAELRVFLYPDRAARVRAEEALPPAKYLKPSDEVGMEDRVTLISTENLIALLSSRNEHQRERVADALLAGPPQPR